jgi:hypothetical protein
MTDIIARSKENFSIFSDLVSHPISDRIAEASINLFNGKKLRIVEPKKRRGAICS